MYYVLDIIVEDNAELKSRFKRKALPSREILDVEVDGGQSKFSISSTLTLILYMFAIGLKESKQIIQMRRPLL